MHRPIYWLYRRLSITRLHDMMNSLSTLASIGWVALHLDENWTILDYNEVCEADYARLGNMRGSPLSVLVPDTVFTGGCNSMQVGERVHTALPGVDNLVEVHITRTDEGCLVTWLGNAARDALVKKVHDTALRDPLTGLPGRALLSNNMASLLITHSVTGTPFPLFMMDLDKFKAVNDTYGHEIGDAMLQVVAQRAEHATKKLNGFVARLAGDEFVVVFPHVTDDAAAIVAATQVRDAIIEPVELAGKVHSLGCSFGGAMYPADGTTTQALLRMADRALYQIKQAGRGGVLLHNSEVSAKHDKRSMLAAGLRTAIFSENADGITLKYHPLLATVTRMPITLEALLRWQHPRFGDVPPAQVIELAEAIGLSQELGSLVFTLVCKQLRKWMDAHLTVLPVSINVSPAQLRDPHFVKKLLSITKDYGIQPKLLDIEFTEKALAPVATGDSAADPTLDKLRQLYNNGFGVVMDDFGQGASSISVLHNVPMTKFKIASNFVRAVPGNARAEMLLSGIIGLARGLRVFVAAEGVEREDQVEWLALQGVQAVQGFRFTEPLDAEATTAYLSSHGERN